MITYPGRWMSTAGLLKTRRVHVLVRTGGTYILITVAPSVVVDHHHLLV